MLKVKCIKNQGKEDFLTVDKVYEIGMDASNDTSIYVAMNDKGIPNAGYSRENFQYVVRR